ncbi:MAG: YitT family protein [Pseudobdellovibrio sp.]
MFIKNTNRIKNITDVLFIGFGILAACVGLKGFLLPNGFFDGGAMGISLLLKHFTNGDLSFFVFLVNIPFVFFGFRQISSEFALKSAVAISLLALSIYFISIPVFTEDKLLISIFGGVFLGGGVGLSIRGGAVLDGSEVLAVQLSRKSSLSVGDVIALFNLVLFFCVAAFINLETAMYSTLTYIAASKTVDFILNGIEEYIGITVVSPKSDEIKKSLTENLQRGVTVYKTEGGFGKTGAVTEDRKALFCVVTRLEVTRIINEISHIDAQAFVIQHSIKDTRGGMIKKRSLH